jgi:hypothetical protein
VPNLDSSIYQSLGNCQGLCRGSFAYGIVLAKDCWCSNTAPSDKEDITNCNDTCFGYPYERCGSAANKLYGYIAASEVAGVTSSASSSVSQICSNILTCFLIEANWVKRKMSLSAGDEVCAPLHNHVYLVRLCNSLGTRQASVVL